MLLEALDARRDGRRAWERFAAELAAAHRGTAHSQFGWSRDGYLGRLRQVNTWTTSGHDFFAAHRLHATCVSRPPGRPWTPATARPWSASAVGCRS